MRKLFAAPLAAVVLVAALVVAIPVQAKGGASVSVKDNFFSPKSTTIKKGSSVKWTWTGRAPHNVTFRSTHSKTQMSGSFSVTFNNKGTFDYRCTIHPGMTGSITVTK